MMDYEEFVASKALTSPESGFDPGSEISDVLFPFQRDIVRWACKGGRRAIFAAFGLGKSLMQLELMRLIGSREGGRQLIVCPLGVRQEFKRDAKLLGLEPKFIRRSSEVACESGLFLTNYESVRDDKLDVGMFNATTLDEASVLRSYGSKTYQTFLEKFRDVPYRFVATATPSPNRHKELIHYAGYLGVMDTGQALTRFFKRDSTKANNLTLYPHKEREFWLWLASWGVFVQKPSDLGYSDEGYDLPELDVRWHMVSAKQEDYKVDRDGQSRLFKDAAKSLSDAAAVKRETMQVRIAKAKEIVDESPDDHFILWHDLEAERHAIKRAMPEVVEVYGSQDLETREERIVGFSDGDFRLLATKPILSGSGCNFQRFCHREIFVGVGFKFNDFIQSIHRVQRFQQTERVRIDIIYAEMEQEVVRVLKRKWKEYEELTENMERIIKEYGLADAAIADAMRRSMGVERIEASGEGWLVANNDTVEETRLLDDDSLDLIVTSVPFSNHYEYTPNYNDFGHTDDDEHFFRQMDYLTPELYRALKPGRIMAVHTKDRINFGNVTGKGVPTVQPFHAECIAHYLKHGFDYMAMITVVTDVVRENNQTYRLGWTEMCKDDTKMGAGSPEYILILHKPQTDRTRGYADVPVVHSKKDYSRARWQVDAHAFWRSSGERPITAEEFASVPTSKMGKLFREETAKRLYDYESHVKIGEEMEGRGRLPATFMAIAPGSWHDDVWDDVNRMLTLNTSQAQKGREMHVCPLQFDIVDRLIERYSNPGELVYDPFGGLFTVPLRAIHMGREGRAVELNTGYFLDGVKYLQAEEARLHMPTLFDLEGITA